MKTLVMAYLVAACFLSTTARPEQVERMGSERRSQSRLFEYWLLTENARESPRGHRVLVEFRSGDARLYWNRYVFFVSKPGPTAIPLFPVDSPSARSAFRRIREAEGQVAVSVLIDENVVARGSLADFRMEAVAEDATRPKTVPLNEARLSRDSNTADVSVLATPCCGDDEEAAAYEEWVLCTSQCMSDPLNYYNCIYNCEQGNYRFCFGSWTQLPTERTPLYDTPGYYDCKSVGGYPIWVNYYTNVGQCRDRWRRTWDCDGSYEESWGAPYSCDITCRRLSGFCQVPYGNETLGCD